MRRRDAMAIAHSGWVAPFDKEVFRKDICTMSSTFTGPTKPVFQVHDSSIDAAVFGSAHQEHKGLLDSNVLACHASACDAFKGSLPDFQSCHCSLTELIELLFHAWAMSPSAWEELKTGYRDISLTAPCCGAPVVPVRSPTGWHFPAQTDHGLRGVRESLAHIACKSIMAAYSGPAGARRHHRSPGG